MCKLFSFKKFFKIIVQIDVSDVSSSEKEIFEENEENNLHFDDPVIVPTDEYVELKEDASLFNKDLNAYSTDDDYIKAFHQFLLLTRMKQRL